MTKKKFTSTMQGDIKKFACSAFFDFSKPKEFITRPDPKTEILNMIKADNPLESVLQTLNLCELKTITDNVNRKGIAKHYKSLTVSSTSDYDLKRWFGKVSDPNQFTFINVVIDIKLNDKIEGTTKEELQKAVETYSHVCPVYVMLASGTMPVNMKYNLL